MQQTQLLKTERKEKFKKKKKEVRDQIFKIRNQDTSRCHTPLKCLEGRHYIAMSQFFPPREEGGGVLFLKLVQSRGVMKKLLRNRGQLKGGGSLQKERGVSKLFYQFLFRKACFHYYQNTWFFFFCLINIYACCNQQIYSFMWFTFYQKVIYYEISFPLTLIFK